MRILVHEFVSGGGLSGRAAPPSLRREGAAMLAALVADLAAVPGHQLVTTIDPRYRLDVPAGVDVIPLPASSSRPYPRNLDPLMSSADAVWLIAPETDRCLERLARRVEASGVALLGSGADAIRGASDKAALARLLARRQIAHPKTRSVGVRRPHRSHAAVPASMIRAIGYPMVVKPARGAGSEGVWLVRDAAQLRRALQTSSSSNARRGRLLLQAYVPGVPASVCLLADGRRAVAIAVNGQDVRAGRLFSYRGGCTPLTHPLAQEAAAAAVRACEAVPGLRGYIGVDLVLTATEAVVIEINPRLTTAYLGIRHALRANVAQLAMAACGGTLPAPMSVGVDRRPIRFSSAGRILP